MKVDRLVLGLLLGISGATALPKVSLAQLVPSNIVPDDTLGVERSQINPWNAQIDVIEGGAARGINLFQSFREFNVGEGRTVYFTSPNLGIQNILARVTGTNPSEILGRLGTALIDGNNLVNSNASLFLINPNGIVFGANSSLDVDKSFTATTPSAIEFGDRGSFGTNQLDTPSALLTINPSAFLFNQIAPGNIVVQANQAIPGNGAFGLRVPNGESLFLLGGNVIIAGGRLNALGGRVEIGAVAGMGAVGINSNGSLSFPTDLLRADVGLTNQALINVAADQGGNVAISARNLDLSRSSRIEAGILSGLGTIDTKAGDITLNLTETLQMQEQSGLFNVTSTNSLGNSGNIRIASGSFSAQDNSVISTVLFGTGNAGDIIIETRDRVLLSNDSRITTNIAQAGSGNAGNIWIRSKSIDLENLSRLTSNISGQGSAGNITLQASDQVTLKQGALILSGVQGGIGQGGNIRIHTERLSLDEGAKLYAFNGGEGTAGNISIEASNQVFLNNDSSIWSFSDRGNGGNIDILTGMFLATNNASLQTQTFGEGNSGNISIKARDYVNLNNNANIVSNAQTASRGRGGNLFFQTGSLFLANGASLSASTYGKGNAGNITVEAGDQVFVDGGGDGSNLSGIFNQVMPGGSGQGGNILINAGSLTVTNLGTLQAFTGGAGNAGSVMINARDHVTFQGSSPDGVFRSGAFSIVGEEAVGNSGNIEITAKSLTMSDRAQLNVSTLGKGNAGNAIVRISDTALFNDGSILNRLGVNAVGNSGNIEVTAASLLLINGGQLDASTFGQGNSGNIIVNARDMLMIDGFNPNKDGINPVGPRSSTLFAEVIKGAEGKGGDVQITTGDLLVTNGGQLDTKTRGQGDGGNIIINARDRVVFDGARSDNSLSTRVLTSVEKGAVGNGGKIDITARSLTVSNGAQLLANTLGQGNAGNILINAQDTVSFDGVRADGEVFSAAFARVNEEGIGQGGDIQIKTGSLSLTNGAALIASAEGRGNAGKIIVSARNTIAANDGLFSTFALRNSGGGAISLTAKTIRLLGNSDIATFVTSGVGGGGNITLTASSIIALNDSDILAFARDGRGGNVKLDTRAFFGQNYRPAAPGTNPLTLQRNDRVDINATGTVSGIITLPDVRFIQNSLNQLPNNQIDTNKLLAQTCLIRQDQPEGTFYITGTGGIPNRPNDPALSAYPTNTIQPTAQTAQKPWKLGDPIVEPQGFYKLANGRLVMSRECQSP